MRSKGRGGSPATALVGCAAVVVVAILLHVIAGWLLMQAAF